MSDKIMELLEKIGVGLLGAGVMFIIFTIINISDNAKKPEDYNTLSMSDFCGGMMVEGDIDENFGWYVEPDNVALGPARSSGWYYLIKCGENGYMAFYTNDEALSKRLDTQSATHEVIHFKGQVTEMDSVKSVKFYQKLRSMGYNNTQFHEVGLPMYINECVSNRNNIVPVVIGVLLMVLGGAVLFIYISRRKMGY